MITNDLSHDVKPIRDELINKVCHIDQELYNDLVSEQSPTFIKEILLIDIANVLCENDREIKSW